ncbi:MAG: AbrB/MazE/SpoVT family DNA-binding domain-containing protein [Candidatus Scalindua sp.]|nr:AbrB/MazE/SpoVT family DNA-binding domain-containing protein [Candidatus Scalindua sp.]
MLTVTISHKYQVVIPKEIRKVMDIHPGKQVQVLPCDNRIEFIPVKHLKKMRGFLKGIDTTVKRDKDRL